MTTLRNSLNLLHILISKMQDRKEHSFFALLIAPPVSPALLQVAVFGFGFTAVLDWHPHPLICSGGKRRSSRSEAEGTTGPGPDAGNLVQCEAMASVTCLFIYIPPFSLKGAQGGFQHIKNTYSIQWSCSLGIHGFDYPWWQMTVTGTPEATSGSCWGS